MEILLLYFGKMKTNFLSRLTLLLFSSFYMIQPPLYQIIPIVISGRTDTKNMIFEYLIESISWIYFYFFAMFDNVSWLICCNPLSKIIKFCNNKKDRVPFWSLDIFNSVHRHPEFLGAHPYQHCVLIFRVFLSTPAPTLPHKKNW